MTGKLAVNGGKPCITKEGPHYIWPIVTDEMKSAVLGQMDESLSVYDNSGVIGRLEKKFEDYFGLKHALLTNSGTTALWSLYVGAGLKPEDEVIVPAYTFFATVTPLLFTGAVPMLSESCMDGNIDPGRLEERITDKTKAMVVTHMWGLPCKMDRITEIAKKHELALFEDCSHSHGATIDGKHTGTFGNGAAWSLNVQKQVSAGEGGVIGTNDDEIFYRALLHGQYNKRCLKEIPKEHPLYRYGVTGMGMKLRIHTLAAAIADQQFGGINESLKTKRYMADEMVKELSGIPGIEPPRVPSNVKPTWYAFLMQYKPEELGGLPVRKFYDAVKGEGGKEIDMPGSTCPLNYHPLFQDPGGMFPQYAGKFSYTKEDFPVAKNFHENSLKLPVWDRLEDLELAMSYVDTIRKVSENYTELL